MELTKATLAGGCFWCLEAVYQRIEGIHRVMSGYTGGHTNNPDYRSICSGMTGHAEVVQLDFDSEMVSYSKVLDWFWRMHDPTTLNRQGNDVGSQYRSVVFYTEEDQKPTVDRTINKLRDMGINVVTEVHPAVEFYRAEEAHQDFFNRNPGQAYCNFAIPPKLAKLRKEFSQYMTS